MSASRPARSVGRRVGVEEPQPVRPQSFAPPGDHVRDGNLRAETLANHGACGDHRRDSPRTIGRRRDDARRPPEQAGGRRRKRWRH
jgi:hypothetical protein